MEQYEQQFNWMLEYVRGAKSILEIGSRDGASLAGMAAVAAPGAKLRCIDYGWAIERPTSISKPALLKTIGELCARGFDAQERLANSHDPESLDWAKEHGPYDFVFIDGDHDYDGVLLDWQWYGPLGKKVAFHDIAAPELGVRQLWDEIKKQGHRTEEIGGDPGHMGIGLVIKDRY